MNALAIPTPAAGAVVTPADVDRWADQIELHLPELSTVSEVRDVLARWEAVTTYVRRTSRAGLARAEEARTRIDQRLGELVIAERKAGRLASHGGNQSDAQGCASTSTDIGIHRNDIAAAVALVEHPEIVAAVLADSDDTRPATRNRLRTAIREHKHTEQIAQDRQDLATMLHDRGIVPLTDPAVIAAQRARHKLLASYAGTVRGVLEYFEEYTAAELLAHTDDRLWPAMLADTRQAIELLQQITQQKESDR